MDTIRSLPTVPPTGFAPRARMPMFVDRMDLEKRTWRGTAADGREFGFDLEAPLRDGTVFFADDVFYYVVAQKPERVLEAVLPPESLAAARLGWSLGNLRFPLELTVSTVRVPDDLAVRRIFVREGVAFREIDAVFQPLKAAPPVR